MHTHPKRVCLEGLESEILKLVSHAATPEQWAEWLRVPLEHAAARGNLDLFNTLLEAGANGSAGWRGCRGRTLLDAAAVGGSVDVMSALLQAGAQPDVNVVPVSSGRSALYTATFCGHEACARRLVVAGADVDFEDPELGKSVLHEAIEGGHEQLVNDLVLSGANLNTASSNNVNGLSESPLHLAAANGSVGMVSTLLLRGADKDALDIGGYTPLMTASNNGHLSVAETLLAAGADFNVRDADRSISVLDLAVETGDVDILKAVLGRGADVNAQDIHGYTALHTAAHLDEADSIDTIVKAGADIEVKDCNGLTPLSLAACRATSKALLLLLQYQANHTARDNDGHTTLHQACRTKVDGMAVTVDLLLRWGADETARNDAGNTPLQELRIDVDADNGINPCSEEEIERTRLLLSRAPAGRAWRRRCWPVMLRSRSNKARKTVSNCDRGGGGRWGVSSVSGEEQGGGDSTKVARIDNGREVADPSFSEVVQCLVGLQSEGLFRTIVGFL